MNAKHIVNRDGSIYIAIDLKSFYASVECMEQNRDPLTTNLVVADAGRTSKTICLAVTPSLKAYGIPGRARLFEVEQKVREANAIRQQKAPNRTFDGESDNALELEQHPEKAIGFLIAPPRMALYMEYSKKIYQIYLRFIAAEDIHVYSIDEVFLDVTKYLKIYQLTAYELARKIIREVLLETGITATAGIGTNLYLCKVAMDIVAKHIPADSDGVRIAELDEIEYRKQLWEHRPLVDFWRVGPGYAKKLEAHGLYTMGDIARCSIGKDTDYFNEELLYKMFGVNAELLIDHAWGYEPCTIADVKAYKPSTNSICSGQVLQNPYTFEQAKLIVREMVDLLALDLVEKRLVTDQIVLTIGYDVENVSRSEKNLSYQGEVTEDRYGRKVPKPAHGTTNLERQTSASTIMTKSVLALYDRIVDPQLLIRRVNLCADHVVNEKQVRTK